MQKRNGFNSGLSVFFYLSFLLTKAVNGLNSGLYVRYASFLLMKAEHQAFIQSTMYVLESLSCQLIFSFTGPGNWPLRLLFSLFPVSLSFMQHCLKTNIYIYQSIICSFKTYFVLQ